MNEISVNGSNLYNESCLNEMIKTLDDGKRIRVYIDCIGHTRNNITQEQYKTALENHYGDKLHVKYNYGVCSYSYSYWI